jgi:hypothetical protein
MRNRRLSLLTGPHKEALTDTTGAVTAGTLTASAALLFQDLLPKPSEAIELSPVRPCGSSLGSSL